MAKEAQMIWLAWLKGLWSKAAFKVGLAAALALVCYFRAVAWKDAAVLAERNIWLHAPADTNLTKRIDSLHIVIEGLTVELGMANAKLDGADLTFTNLEGTIAWYKQLVNSLSDTLNTKPFKTPVASFLKEVPTIWHGREYVDQVGGEYHFPPTNEFRNIKVRLQNRLADTVLTRYDTTITKTVFEPYHANLLDLFVESKIGGVFGVKGLAGYAQTGVDINIGAVQISGGIGAASKDNKLNGLWTVGLKVSTR
jgi:hypothetical protein